MSLLKSVAVVCGAVVVVGSRSGGGVGGGRVMLGALVGGDVGGGD